MPQQPVNFRCRSNAVIASTDQDNIDAAVPVETAAAESHPADAARRTVPGVSHLQSAWRVRQFAGSAYFGSVAIPRLMSKAEIAEVQEALDQLGPFGNDRIDNCARLHAALISANAASAHAVLTLVRHRIVNPNQRSPDGDTLLHSLIEYGRLHPLEGLNESTENSIRFEERFIQLVAAGASLYVTDGEGRTPFERILSSSRPDWQPVAEALLQIAPEKVYLRKVRNGPTLLHRAARLNDATLVARWLALKLPTEIGVTSWRDVPDPEIRTPLRRALKAQTLAGLEIARMLIAGGANPHQRSPYSGNSMLHRAACDADMTLIKGWIAAGLSLNEPTARRSRITALMLAVIYRPNRADLLTLLAQNAQINARDSYGRTALHHAVLSRKTFPALDALIAAGADLNMHNYSGRSPLETSIATACTCHDDSGFWTLVAHGADLDLPNPRTGQTPRRLYQWHSFRWSGVPLP